MIPNVRGAKFVDGSLWNLQGLRLINQTYSGFPLRQAQSPLLEAEVLGGEKRGSSGRKSRFSKVAQNDLPQKIQEPKNQHSVQTP